MMKKLNEKYDKLYLGWLNLYNRARYISKWSQRLMYLCALILLLNVYSNIAIICPYWDKVLTLNALLLFAINLALLYVGYLNFSARSNRLAWAIDDAYGTNLSEVKCPSNYYDNQNVCLGNLRFTLNIYESCFFSYSILSRMKFQILIKNLIVLIPILFAFTLNKNGWIVTILQCFLSFYLIRKLIMFIIVGGELKKIMERFRIILSGYKSSRDGILDYQSATLSISDYETSMVWLNSVLSDEVYQNMNEKLTAEWRTMQGGYIKHSDTL